MCICTLIVQFCVLRFFLCFEYFRGSSELYATSSHDDVRVWHADTGKELLQITNSNMICHAVCITPDGKAIITGKRRESLHSCTYFYFAFNAAWDDGKIRAYFPQSGKPMYTIHDAHNKVLNSKFLGYTEIYMFE